MVDVVVIERRVMTAVSDDANAAHIQQPTLGPINRKGESLSRKFSGDDLRRAQSNTTDAHRVKRVGVRRDSRRPAPGRAGARGVIRFATRLQQRRCASPKNSVRVGAARINRARRRMNLRGPTCRDALRGSKCSVALHGSTRSERRCALQCARLRFARQRRRS